LEVLTESTYSRYIWEDLREEMKVEERLYWLGGGTLLSIILGLIFLWKRIRAYISLR